MSNFKTSLVVGGGAMAADQHVPRLLRILDIDLVTVFDIDKYRKSQLQKRFKKNDRVVVVGSLPQNQMFDLVLIATPPKFHFEYFSRLLDSSDHFLVEKPMTQNGKEASKLANMANEHGKNVYVNLIRRTLKSYTLIRNFVESGHFGELNRVAVNEGGVFNWNAVSKGSFSHDLNGGGVLMDTGPHTLDLLFQVFDRLTLIESQTDSKPPAVEANCHLNLLADDRIPIRVTLSRNRNLSNTSIFEFEKARLMVGVMGEEVNVEEISGMHYQIIADGANKNSSWGAFVDKFYHQFLANLDSSGIDAVESEKIALLIDEVYSKSRFVDPGF
jgi:predicted dehydrogenase